MKKKTSFSALHASTIMLFVLSLSIHFGVFTWPFLLLQIVVAILGMTRNFPKSPKESKAPKGVSTNRKKQKRREVKKRARTQTHLHSYKQSITMKQKNKWKKPLGKNGSILI